DPDDFTVLIHQWASRGPRVHGCVELDEAGQGATLVRRLNRAIETADHAGRERSRQREGISDNDGVVTDLQARRISEGGGLKLRGSIRGPERGDVALRDLRNDHRRGLGAVCEYDREALGVLSDLQRGEDYTWVVN